VFVQFFACMRVVVGTIVYVHRLLKEQSCTYVQDLLGRGRSYKLTSSDLSRSYKWSATYLWTEEISIILLRFGFLFVYWRTRLSSDLVILRGLVMSSYLVTLRGLVLVLRFGELDKVTEINIVSLVY
jgi:hypothetical protein